MRLQNDKEQGHLTEEQYVKAVQSINWQKKRQRTTTLTLEQRKVRTSLRTITKWFFDGELFRDDATPLFNGIGESSKIDLSVFLPIAKEIVDHMSGDPDIAAVKSRQTIYTQIIALLMNRRKNIRNNKKPNKDGTRKKQLKSIYETQNHFLIIKGGQSILIGRPQLLKTAQNLEVSTVVSPKPSVVSSKPSVVSPKPSVVSPVVTVVSPVVSPKPSVVSTKLSVVSAKPLVVSQTPGVVSPEPTVMPSKSTVTSSHSTRVSPEDSDSELDLLDEMSSRFDDELLTDVEADVDAKMKKLRSMMSKLSEKKTKLSQVKENVFHGELTASSTSNWKKRVGLTTGGAKTIACSKCNKDFVTSMMCCEDQEEPLCKTCWSKCREQILSISSLTGAKKKRVTKKQKTPNKRGALAPLTPQVQRKRRKQRVRTPPGTKTCKYKVNMFDV